MEDIYQKRRRKSNFVRLFDKTPPGIICPHFYILAHANGCPYDCSYCYLQLTFRGKVKPVLFQNLEDLTREVRQFLELPEPSVLNAGELSDGLAFDHVTGLSRFTVPVFAAQNRHKLLFLTKSDNVRRILDLEHGRQTIVSFSVNASAVSGIYEKAAAPIGKRLTAAGKTKAAGYPVRFRIDPIIPVPGWRNMYEELIDRILDVEPERVTLGTLRYFPNVKSFARKLGRDTSVFDFATERSGEDGRYRVSLDRRLRVYSTLLERINNRVPVGICKETRRCRDVLNAKFALGENVCNCTL
jgi:spore photoproduct lyase